MTFISHYDSPLGGITLAATNNRLCGLWFDGQKYFGSTLQGETKEAETPVLCQTRQWLDIYFAGGQPDFFPSMQLIGTPFQQTVWNILRNIPYGETRTYKEVAAETAHQLGRPHMAAQAVGNAIGHNPISILIPCHRVVGTNGSLTGYAGGTERKLALLQIEHIPYYIK
ncbi:methylated-DNA--[protein]-cysteine S-methyltransferase [Bacteroides mediterraneensis]|uniref:methylated-DNA--[protein]-cysteine S-methyltransferase n=1 Tax=Bacteroides mediterraneensis TaxID=1841856 RepID=UPI0026EA7D69|nr:methylated-DNA--[protein]-cysteine S-methyltransferase [Bacteroides mediterraneensis]